MATRKLFSGAIIRALREERGLTQKALASRIGVSSPYLNQIEADQRPLTAQILVELTRILRVDVATFSDDRADQLLGGLRSALADPVFEGLTVGTNELKLVSRQASSLASAFLALHHAHRRLAERYQSLDDALANAETSGAGSLPSAYDEVRDFFHAVGNYVDPLDRAAESLAERAGLSGDGRLARLAAYLERAHGVTTLLESNDALTGAIRHYDPTARMLRINSLAEAPTQSFALAHQIALLEQPEAIAVLTNQAGFHNADAAAVCRVALANYFAGALILPYRSFREEAQLARHDVEWLARRFEASLEQVCHRLSTMQRKGAEGIPFYFLRVDRAGNITKRHSATRFQFARYGGACPLWNIHEAFESADRMLVQIAEMPDGVRYLSLARGITKSGGSYLAPIRRYAIGFGCELGYASELVYADALDIRLAANAVPIGVSCRLCERGNCHQRAFPPLSRRIAVDPNNRGSVPYSVL